jgi:hypothetical protein
MAKRSTPEDIDRKPGEVARGPGMPERGQRDVVKRYRGTK